MKRPGIYAPLSAHYFDDEAVMEAGEHAELMYVRMLAFAARTPTTEGHLSRAVCVSRLGIVSETDPETHPERRLERLREAGLISETDTGYQINAWLRWNPSAEQLGRERSRDRERKRQTNQPTTRASSENAPETDRESGARSERQIDRSDRSDAQSAASDDAQDRFQEFWDTYDKKRDRKKTEQKYRLAIKKRGVSPDLLIAAAAKYVDYQKRDGKHPEFTKDATTWLNGECWTDELTVTARPQLRAVAGEPMNVLNEHMPDPGEPTW